jgi:hypothetical protein
MRLRPHAPPYQISIEERGAFCPSPQEKGILKLRTMAMYAVIWDALNGGFPVIMRIW